MMWNLDNSVWWGATSGGRMMVPRDYYWNSPFFAVQLAIHTLYELLFLVILVLIVLFLWEKIKKEKRK